MEQTPGQDSVSANGSADKSKVWDVKPLRSLVPIFPSPPNVTSFSTPQGSSPFVCVPPAGPFPPGFSPFYPFVGSPGSPRQAEQTTFGAPNHFAPSNNCTPISMAVPITSYQTPANGDAGLSRRVTRIRAQSQGQRVVDEDGDCNDQNQSSSYMGSFNMHINGVEGMDKVVKGKTRSQKRTKASQDNNFASPEGDTDLIVNNFLASYNIEAFDAFRQADGDKEGVVYVLLIFDLLRRKLTQIEDSKTSNPGQARRADLKAGAVLMSKGIRTNISKRVGAVPGIEIGDIFFFRMEMCIIGLHAPSMAGIDYKSFKINQQEETLAVSIVSSGGYENDVEDENVLVYSGQGGNSYVKDKETKDQKLERGNLALEKSLFRGNEVRVIRGISNESNPTGKVYVYDGLYKIQESWVEKGKSGCNVFKYKLVRLPGQADAFKIWKSIQQWKDGILPRFGIILPDLTSGGEKLPVSLVNDVDDEKGPAYFTYSPSLKYSKPVNPAESFVGCDCHGGCLPTNHNCTCIQKNGSYLPYAVNGVLVNQKSLIYECGPSCQCPPNCRNRVSQGGLRFRLEVFKTKDKGWGLRSLDPIRAGSFICEYAGEVIKNSKEQGLGSETEGDHIFYGNRIYQPLEVMTADSNVAPKLPFPLIISSKDAGNVARFMNHSCSPNLFWQPVLHANSKELDLHIVLHTIRHIPPMTELTYDYGMVEPDKSDQGRKRCSCESPKCKGFFY